MGDSTPITAGQLAEVLAEWDENTPVFFFTDEQHLPRAVTHVGRTVWCWDGQPMGGAPMLVVAGVEAPEEAPT